MRRRPVVPLVALFLFASCRGADAPEANAADAADAAEEYPEAVAADPGHYAVDFENDAIRVLRIAYGAGEASVMHTHPESCAIVWDGSAFTMHLPDGTSAVDPAVDGEVQCLPAGAHRPENTGGSAAEVIPVEQKAGAMAGTAAMPTDPPATEADPQHYTVEEDNDVYRLVRVRYGPGETSVMHSHPAHCIIYLSGGSSIQFELPTGEAVDAPAGQAGALNCGVDAGSHLPTNTGDAPTEVILIELKGRASVS